MFKNSSAEHSYLKLARMWAHPVRPPLSDLEHASMTDLQAEHVYICEQLSDCFANACSDNLDGELLWYQAMNEWLQRLRRVHHEYGTRRHGANEIRKKYEQESENFGKEYENDEV